MLSIFSALRIVDLSDMIMEINIIKAAIFTIITIITIMAVKYKEESFIFEEKKLLL